MSLLKQLTMSVAFMLAIMLCGISAMAQETGQGKTLKPEREIIVERNGVVLTTDQRGPEIVPMTPMAPMPPLPGMGGDGYTFNFVSSEMSFDRKVVKGVPYSAEAVTETVQTLGDGNRIVRKSSAKIYRDSEGRTRRDQKLNAIGPFATSGDMPQMSSINDPVSGVSYTLDERSRTARKLLFKRPGSTPPPGHWELGTPGAPPPPNGAAKVAGPQERSRVMIVGDGPGSNAVFNSEVHVRQGGPEGKELPKPVVESLGKQTVEGVEAEGTRTTLTIPAGEIGNERPIQIISERWYSPELQTVVMTKRNDPLAGETTYRLTNINRSEPDRSLFEVPADYKIKEGAVFEFHYDGNKKPGENK
ncbi:MAG TPA: hypothetical protein VGO91_14575 [Pyrinomonadaceae bacterium]|jgi:hypothetical protein|nr:hypothetical protein [Pyrinomonadaceae bacterium]